ncbi:MAG: hypothetical protein V1926_04815 [Candidatus Peregrinibacteria bacterium]
MEFEYAKREWSGGIIYVPVLPIALNGFPVGHALVDTGADVTLLPMELNQVLDCELDPDHAIPFTSAGGGDFRAIPAVRKIEYRLEQSGFRPIVWKGTAYFVRGQPVILLGQYECLSELILVLDARKRKIRVEGL